MPKYLWKQNHFRLAERLWHLNGIWRHLKHSMILWKSAVWPRKLLFKTQALRRTKASKMPGAFLWVLRSASVLTELNFSAHLLKPFEILEASCSSHRVSEGLPYLKHIQCTGCCTNHSSHNGFHWFNWTRLWHLEVLIDTAFMATN